MQYLGHTYTETNVFFIWNVNLSGSPVFCLATPGSTLPTQGVEGGRDFWRAHKMDV